MNNVKGKYIDNNSSHLVIVFQSTIGLDLTRFNPQDKEYISYVNTAHKRYMWMKTLNQKNDIDFLYIQDNFNMSYGWYLKDNKESVITKVTSFIKKYIKKRHQKVTAFGSSKGGFAALLYGVMLPEITDIVSIVPQIKVKEYLDTIPMYNVLSEYFVEEDNNILFEVAPDETTFTNIKIVTGIYEHPKVLEAFNTYYEYLKNFSNIQVQVVFDMLAYGHNRIAENSQGDILSYIFDDNTQKYPVRIKNIDKDWQRKDYFVKNKNFNFATFTLADIETWNENDELISIEIKDFASPAVIKSILGNAKIYPDCQLKKFDERVLEIEFQGNVFQQSLADWTLLPEKNGVLYQVLLNGLDVFAAALQNNILKDADNFFELKTIFMHYIRSKQKTNYEYYDQAIGSRLLNLSLFFYWNKAKMNLVEQKTFLERIYSDLEKVNMPQYYTNYGNHGVIQAIGQLVAGYVVTERKEYQIGKEKLEKHFQSQFSATGLHNENSAGYQKSIYNIFAGLNKSLKNPYWKEVLKEVLEFSDVETSILTRGDTLYTNKKNVFNKIIERLEDGVVLYNNATYSSGFINGSRSYIHKHKDDLSFNFVYKDFEWFIDPGMVNYNYADPIGVFPTMPIAHNILTIENQYPLWHDNEICHTLKLDKIGENEYVGYNYSYKNAALVRKIKYYDTCLVITDMGIAKNAEVFISNFHLHPELQITNGNALEYILDNKDEEIYLYTKNNLAGYQVLETGSIKQDNVNIKTKLVQFSQKTNKYTNQFIISTERLALEQQQKFFFENETKSSYQVLDIPVFEYKLHAENNKLIVHIDSNIQNDYLVKVFLYQDSKLIERQEVNNNTQAEFVLDRDKKYCLTIRVFLDGETQEVAFGYTKTIDLNHIGEQNYEQMPLKKPDNVDDLVEADKIPLFILGSCVTRDAFEIAPNHSYKIEGYYARTSLFSTFSNHLKEVPTREDIGIEGNFRATQARKEFTKEARYYLATAPVRYILIDLLDERFGLYKFRDSFISNSNELQEAKYYQKYKEEFVNLDKESLSKAKIIEIFYEYLKRYDRDNIIILHKVYCSNQYIDDNGEVHTFEQRVVDENNRINDMLNQFYYYMEMTFPNLKTIQIQDIAYAGHKWGLTPFHYTNKYYEKFIEKLNDIIYER